MTLDLCCNDPNNGLPIGKVLAVNIGELKLHSKAWDWGPRLTEGEGFIRIGRMKLRCLRRTTWCGNWCWNAYQCPKEDIEKLVNWAKFREWFDVEQAPEKIFDAYEAGKPLRFRRPTTTPQGGAA